MLNFGGIPHMPKFQHTAARRRLRKSSPPKPSDLTGFNTQPRGGGCLPGVIGNRHQLPFQHTAARRRLPDLCGFTEFTDDVSTHSRAEAAAPRDDMVTDSDEFQHTAARRRLPLPPDLLSLSDPFQHTAARRRLLQES